MLWEGTPGVSKTVLTSDSTEFSQGTVSVRSAKIVWRNSDGVERFATPSGPHANQVLLVLSNRDLADVQDVRIEHAVAFVSGEQISDTSSLSLQFRPAVGEVAYVVSRDTLSPAAHAGLSKGVIGSSHVPRLHRELANALPFMDLGEAIGRTGAYALTSKVFLNHDGSVAFTESPTTAEEPTKLSLQQQLERLREVSLLLQLQGPEGELLVRAYADRLWLGSRLGVLASEQTALRVSLVFVEPGPGDAEGVDAYAVPAEYVDRVAHYSQMTTGGAEMSLWAKIALTPLAIACDIALQLPLAMLKACLGIDDDDDDDSSRRRSRARDNGNLNDGMSRARPRRIGESEAEWRARENGR